MAFKDVLALFTDARAALVTGAVEIARQDGAHLIGLYLMPPIALFPGGLPYSGSIAELRALELIEADARGKSAEAAAKLEADFNHAADLAGLTREWRVVEGDVDAAAVIHARHADVAVLGQNDPDHPVPAARHLVESVLLGAGRPVVVIPYAGRFERIGGNVLIAWNATREAARAVNDALPLLERAEKVTVLSVNPPQESVGGPAIPGADVALHLARHGVSVEASSTVSHDIDVGNAILSRAADFGADLIVMGGYGHSRQREFMLGGVTRTLLHHMTVPVLLSH